MAISKQKLLYYAKYFLSCLTILPIIKCHKWIKQIKDTNISIKKNIINIVLLCQSYRMKIAEAFHFFNQENISGYANTIIRKFLVFEINDKTFKDFLRLNESFDIVITKFLKIKKKNSNIYWKESIVFKSQINFYITTINAFLGEIRFNFRSWPKKFLRQIYLQTKYI